MPYKLLSVFFSLSLYMTYLLFWELDEEVLQEL